MSEHTKEARKLLDKAVNGYELALTLAFGGKLRESSEESRKATVHCGELTSLLATPPVKPTATSTVWVGLGPMELDRLLCTNETFSRQYDKRAKDCKDCSIPFIVVDKTPIEFIDTEFGLGLGINLFASNEGLTGLNLPTIIFAVEEVERTFVVGMGRFGLSLAKEQLGVFVQTRVV